MNATPDRPSFWLATTDAGPSRPALADDATADVCIVGAGLTGLWTAYALCRAQPGLRVVVLEARYAGFGASGRNGGWMMGELAGSRLAWAAEHGRQAVIAQDRLMRATVIEVGEVIRREQIDCDWVRGGTVRAVQTALESQRVSEHIEELRTWGWDDEDLSMLSAAEVRDRIAVDGALGGSFTPHCARVHPAKLVRGLAAAAERAGVVIHEQTVVSKWAGGSVRTAAGPLVRAPVVVLATEGYTSTLPGRKRSMLPMTSSMIVTVPLSDAQWSAIGWERCETLGDGRHRYAYLQRTADGRIAIGGRGVPYLYGSEVDREGPLPARTARELRARLIELFPSLDGIGIEAGWHGILGVRRDWMPSVGFDRRRGEAWAGGYVGEGVGAANFAGRTLCDLILERNTELTAMPWVDRGSPSWEPEPLRWLGVRGVWSLYAAADSREVRTERPALAGRVADAVSGRRR